MIEFHYKYWLCTHTNTLLRNVLFFLLEIDVSTKHFINSIKNSSTFHRQTEDFLLSVRPYDQPHTLQHPQVQYRKSII